MTRKRGAAVGLALALAAGGPGCGYALVGKGVTTDVSIKRIGVPMFRDLTGKPGLDQKITEKVIEELLKRGRFDVVQQTAGVDATVDGELTAFLVTPVGFSDAATQTQANRYSVVLIARVKYAKVGERESIWESDAFSYRDEYDVSDEPGAFVQLEGQAIDRLSTQFARSLVAAMLEAF